MKKLKKNDKIDVLELISWRKIVIIYLRCLVFNIFVLIKRFLRGLRSKVDKKFHVNEKLRIYKKFNFLSGNATDDQKSISYDKTPGFLINTNLGSHSFVKLKNTKIHYLENGNKQNSVILLLHGFPDCWITWRNQILLLKDHFRVIAPDLKGFNDSEKPDSRREYRPNKICEEIKQFLEVLGVEEVILMGHDLGGLIGWIFAAQYPHLVKKLIVVSAPHPNLNWDNLPKNSVLNEAWFQFIQFPRLPEEELESSENFISKFFAHLEKNHNSELVDDQGKFIPNADIVDAYKYIFSRTKDWTGPLNYYRNFYFYRIKEQFKVECPSLLIFGNDENFHRIETIIKSSEFCEQSTIKIIDGGHYPHQQSSKEFNKVLINYLLEFKKVVYLMDMRFIILRKFSDCLEEI